MRFRRLVLVPVVMSPRRDGHRLVVGRAQVARRCSAVVADRDGAAARGDSRPAPAAGHQQARRQTTRTAVASPDVGGAAPAATARATEARREADRFGPGPARGATAETANAGSRKRAVTASPANDNRQHGSQAHGERGSDMRAPAALPTAAHAAGRAVQLERRRLHTRVHGQLAHPRLVEDHTRGGRFGLGESTTQSAERRADCVPTASVAADQNPTRRTLSPPQKDVNQATPAPPLRCRRFPWERRGTVSPGQEADFPPWQTVYWYFNRWEQ